MIAVDTNILVYAHRPEMPFHTRVREVLTEAVSAPQPVCVPWHCVHEFLALVSNPRIFRDPTPMDVSLDAARRLLTSLSGGYLAEGEDYWMRSIESPGQPWCRVHSCTMPGWPHCACFMGCVCYGPLIGISPVSPI